MLVNHVNDKFLVIEPLLHLAAVSDKSLFSLGISNRMSGEIFEDMDLIDILTYNQTSFIRLRNYHGV